MLTDRLILYGHTEQCGILRDMTCLTEHCGDVSCDREKLTAVLYECLRSLIEMASDCGFEGNLWHDYLTFLLVSDENAYSTACEITGTIDGSVNDAALHDMEIFMRLFAYDFRVPENALGIKFAAMLTDYKNVAGRNVIFERRIRDAMRALSRDLSRAKSAEEFKDTLTGFYGNFGVGKFGLHKAFRVACRAGGADIIPITNTARVSLDDLVGYEAAKQKLIENTEAFVDGRSANNCLLFGDAGTGKSSSVKAILNRYCDRGLRMIEIYKHQFKDLNEIIARIKNRNYKFIIFMDDLSFEEYEIEYKYLKAVIEGGLEEKPENVLIYATSNRRHLVKETFKDKQDVDEEIHTNDTVQEKLSLAARFGVTIFFGRPDQKEFRKIVKTLAERGGIKISESELYLEAGKWELSHGGLSGRCARQFIDYLTGKEAGKSSVIRR